MAKKATKRAVAVLGKNLKRATADGAAVVGLTMADQRSGLGRQPPLALRLVRKLDIALPGHGGDIADLAQPVPMAGL